MARVVQIGNRLVGDGQPVYIVGEIGINHNGEVDIAKRLIGAAHAAGVDAVKFQKRTPERSVPPNERDKRRETPWGYITYLEYRRQVELGEQEYREIDSHCRTLGLAWFASVWDEESVDFMERFSPPCYKIPSAALTDTALLLYARERGRPVILSTGMSTDEEIRQTVQILGTDRLLLTHCTSTYPCRPEELNLRVIETLRRQYPVPIGYSGHEVGLPTTVAAVALGACYVERHITLDRSMWGSDQPSSVEPQGMDRLVRYIRGVEAALGDGKKRVYESELPNMRRLRRINART